MFWKLVEEKESLGDFEIIWFAFLIFLDLAKLSLLLSEEPIDSSNSSS